MTSSRPFFAALLSLALSPLLGPAVGPPPREPTLDEALCRQVGQATDPRALLAYLRQRSPSPEDARLAARLVERLGDDGFAKRREAARRLEELGLIALPALRKNKDHGDLEVRRAAG